MHLYQKYILEAFVSSFILFSCTQNPFYLGKIVSFNNLVASPVSWQLTYPFYFITQEGTHISLVHYPLSFPHLPPSVPPSLKPSSLLPSHHHPVFVLTLTEFNSELNMDQSEQLVLVLSVKVSNFQPITEMY